jgi:hypothetical protein
VRRSPQAIEHGECQYRRGDDQQIDHAVSLPSPRQKKVSQPARQVHHGGSTDRFQVGRTVHPTPAVHRQRWRVTCPNNRLPSAGLADLCPDSLQYPC